MSMTPVLKKARMLSEEGHDTCMDLSYLRYVRLLPADPELASLIADCTACLASWSATPLC
jgi:hypothetical protein